jgi:iron-sulfur cluster assembly protein
MTELTVSITDNAAAELKNIRVEENIAADKILRLGVKGGGCSGLSYILEFEEKTAFDEELKLNDVPVIIDKRQMMYLVGMELDYQYGLNNRGFIFNNPNAKTTCGCGTSFSA